MTSERQPRIMLFFPRSPCSKLVADREDDGADGTGGDTCSVWGSSSGNRFGVREIDRR